MANRCLHLMEGGKLDSRCCFSNAFNCALSLSHKEKNDWYKVVVCARKEFISETAAKSMRNGMHIDRRQQFIFP